MIDATKEQLLSLSEAACKVPRVSKKKVSTSTLWRWCRRGLHGVKLEYAKVGRRIATSEEALARFFAAGAASDRELPVGERRARQTRSRPRDRDQAIAQAEAELARDGL